ncbi:MAG: 3-hydroxyacyl-CoA dehydrogenase family protein [Dehalococcoidales bacterium]
MKLEDIKRVGVVGAGTMGPDIAINFALWRYPTMLCDVSDTVLEKSIRKITRDLSVFVQEGLVTQQQVDEAMAGITTTTQLAKVAESSDFITEAIPESVEDKRKLFNQLDRLCLPHTIIASNTSFLLLSEFGSEVKRQDKIAITHYFIPPHIIPGVEVGVGPETSEETINIICELLKTVRKVPIRVLKESPGCLVNRIQAALRREAFRVWAEGLSTAEDIDLGVRATFGFRLPLDGPITHYDLSGVWQWDREVRIAWAEKQFDSAKYGLEEEVATKIKRRVAQGNPWIIDPNQLDELKDKIEREYISCLKKWYWPQE